MPGSTKSKDNRDFKIRKINVNKLDHKFLDALKGQKILAESINGKNLLRIMRIWG